MRVAARFTWNPLEYATGYGLYLDGYSGPSPLMVAPDNPSVEVDLDLTPGDHQFSIEPMYAGGAGPMSTVTRRVGIGELQGLDVSLIILGGGVGGGAAAFVDNDAPAWIEVPGQQVVNGDPYSLDLSAYVADTDAITLTASGLPAGLSLFGTVISGTPTVDGTSTVQVQATDGVNNGRFSADLTVGNTFSSVSFAPQSGVFTLLFSLYLPTTPCDVVVGLSETTVSSYAEMVATVRASTAGYFEVRGEGSYTADTQVPFIAGNTYQLEMTCDVLADTFSVDVNGTRIATDYLFRSGVQVETALEVLTHIDLLDTSGVIGSPRVARPTIMPIEFVVFTPDEIAPDQPTAPTLGTINDTSVILNMPTSAATDHESFSVYRSIDDISFSLVQPGVSGSSYTDTGLTADTTYYWRVTDVDTSSNESVQSASASGTTSAAGSGVIPTQNQASVTQYGITWSFDQNYPVGQFVTGDYFVIGSPTITSITADGSTGPIGGSMVNPSTRFHAYNSSISNYDVSLAFTSGTLSPGDSLISTTLQNGNNVNWAGVNQGSNANVTRAAAVLTCMASAPSTGSFRPAFSGTDKTIHTTSSINYGAIPNLSRAGFGSTPAPTFSNNYSGVVEYFERSLARPWHHIHLNDWQARKGVASLNGFDYHEEVGKDLGRAYALLCLDWTGLDKTDKTTLTNNIIQNGLDHYYNWIGTSDETSSYWSPMFIFPGALLGLTAMRDYWVDNPSASTGRDEKMYYADDLPASAVANPSSIVPSGQTWVGWAHPRNGTYPAFRKQPNECYEHLQPSEWSGVVDAIYSESYPGKPEVYRTQHDCYPWIGMALAVLKLGESQGIDLRDHYASSAAMDYFDRWMNEGFTTNEYLSTGRTYYEEFQFQEPTTVYYIRYGTSTTGWVDDMWDTYRGSLS